MLKKIFKGSIVAFIATFCVHELNAGVLEVRDGEDGEPLDMVTIYTPDQTVQVTTDEKGQADISDFQDADSVIVQMMGYGKTKYTYDQLSAQDYQIQLMPKELEFGEAVISAGRDEEDSRDVPARISSISQEQIEIQNPQTSADLLEASGDVFVQKSQLGGGSPMLRGYATNRVLLTVDGVRKNNAIFRGGNIQNIISIDPNWVENTEVLFGPGAVMYGSDAIGGTMNFYTKSPRLGYDGNTNLGANAMARYSSVNNEQTGHVNFNIGFDNWGFLTSVSYSNFDDLRMGSRGSDFYLRKHYQDREEGADVVKENPDPEVQRHTGYDQYSVMQKARFMPNDYWDVEYAFHYSETSDIPRFDRLIEGDKTGNLNNAEWYYGPQKWMMNKINVRNFTANTLYDELDITLAQQYFEESRHNRSFGSETKNHRTEMVDAYSFNADLQRDFGQAHRLSYGIEGVANLIGSEAEQRNINTGETNPRNTRYPDDAQWASASVYANHRYRITDNVTLRNGLRYNYINAHAEFDDEFFDFPFDEATINTGAFTGSAGATYRPTVDWQFNANFSTGFRAPNIHDLGRIFDSEPGAVVVPNPDLEPEYSYTGELGAERSFGDVAQVEVTGYYSYLDNALARREFQLNGQDSIEYEGEMSQVLAIQNATNASVYGVQTSGELRLPYGFGVRTSFTYQVGNEETEDGEQEPLRHSVPWFGTSHLTFEYESLTADFYARYQGAVPYSQMAPSEVSKTHLYKPDSDGNPHSPQWTTLNLKAQYQITDYLRVNTGIENITDLRYRSYSSGITAPGRNYVISLNASF